MGDDLSSMEAAGEQPVSQETTETTQTTETSQPEKGSDPNISDNGKKPIKVPESLKPKSKDDRPEWVKYRFADYARERDSLKARIAELEKGQVPRVQDGKQSGKQDAPPNIDEFEKYQDYVDALVDYKVSQREKAQQQKSTEEGYRQYQQEKRQEFETHAAEIVQQVPEFWDAVTDPTLPVTDAMAEAVMELGQMAPYTMLWLASNRQEALRMAKLPPRAATVAIGKLAVQLEREWSDTGESGSQPVESTPKFQPKPVPQIRGGSPGNIDQGPSDKDDTRTWMVKEAERQRKKFGNANLRVYVPK